MSPHVGGDIFLFLDMILFSHVKKSCIFAKEPLVMSPTKFMNQKGETIIKHEKHNY